MVVPNPEFQYPRRRVVRRLLRWLTSAAFALLTDCRITGRENLPQRGPLLVAGNHFSFVDPAAMIHATPWPLEFLGGFDNPSAPSTLTWLPKVWGRYAVHRGTGSRYALQGAEEVLKQDGVVGIFPEAGSWAATLRPARPGMAFLAARTGALILPVAFDGMVDVFPRLNKGRRARVSVRFGKPLGPFQVTGAGRARRRQLDEIGDRVMKCIAELLPPERRGVYSDDAKVREAAMEVRDYPWAHAVEGEVPRMM